MSLDLSTSAVVLLGGATPSPTPVPTIDPARVTPGLLGLASLLFLVIAGFFLARSMIKQFKKIDFDEDATELGIARPEQPQEAASASAGAEPGEGTPGGAAT